MSSHRCDTRLPPGTPGPCKAGPEHENLAKAVGEWRGPETMFPSPWSPEAQERVGESSARMLEGFFVVTDYVQRAGDEATFRGHGVFSWDRAAQEYVMYWFDSMGGADGVARGQMEGNQLTFRSTSPMGHHRYRYTFNDGETVFEMAMPPGGNEWQALMEAHYRPVV